MNTVSLAAFRLVSSLVLCLGWATTAMAQSIVNVTPDALELVLFGTGVVTVTLDQPAPRIPPCWPTWRRPSAP